MGLIFRLIINKSLNESVVLHSEFERLLFSQADRETDRFFAESGVQLTS
jgi:hypothetical protein